MVGGTDADCVPICVVELDGGAAPLAARTCGAEAWGGGGAAGELGVDGGNGPVDAVGAVIGRFDGIGAAVVATGGAVSGTAGCPAVGAGAAAVVAAAAAPTAGTGVTLAAVAGAAVAGGIAADAVAGWTTCVGVDVAVGVCAVDAGGGVAGCISRGAEDADWGSSTSARSIAAGWVVCDAMDGCIGSGGSAVLACKETGGATRGCTNRTGVPVADACTAT